MSSIENIPLDDRPEYNGDNLQQDAAGGPSLLESPRPQVLEACDNLRAIRDIMERSTKHSSLSGLSGIVVGIWAIVGVLATWLTVERALSAARMDAVTLVAFAATWIAVLALSIATDFLITKSRAARVGKQFFSKLGTHVVGAAAPGFTAGLVFSLNMLAHNRLNEVWGYWMLAYGVAICAVGLFSVRPVIYLGWAFVVAGALTLFLPAACGLAMMAIAFGGFHIAYGLYTGVSRSDW